METLTSYHAQRQISDKFKASFKINQTNIRKKCRKIWYDSDTGEILLRKIQNAKATKEKTDYSSYIKI